MRSTAAQAGRAIDGVVEVLAVYGRLAARLAVTLCLLCPLGCARDVPAVPTLNWYVFDERSGAFDEAARPAAPTS